MQAVTIETTQNVHIRLNLASLGQRVGAFVIDILITYITLTATLAFIAQLSGFGGEGTIWIAGGLFLLLISYHLVMEFLFEGQSVGKMMVGIRVIREDGRSGSFFNYFMRWILRPVDIAATFGVVAIVSVAVTGKQQRLGDILAGTVVVRTRSNAAKIGEQERAEMISSDYVITYPQVSVLTDEEIRKIRRLFNEIEQGDHDYYTSSKLMIQLKSAVVKKMGIPAPDEEARLFLKRVVQDYKAMQNPLRGG
jgi:uncharacterized RDD family membrane protein YckC